MLSQEPLKKAILQEKLIPPQKLAELAEEAKDKRLALEDIILEKDILPEDKLYQAVALFLKIPFVDLKTKTIRKDILTLIPEPLVQAHQVVAFEKDEKEIKIASLDPEDLQTFEFIKKKTGLEVKVHLTTPTSIREVLKQFHKGLKAEFKEITQKEEEKKEERNGKDLEKLAKDLPVIRIVDTLLEYAIFENASDIHIEPAEKEVMVRYRIDGILKDVMTLPKNIQSGVVARIKILSNLKLDEHRLPQDGRFKVVTDEYKVAFRVSILPVYNGEKIVLRLLSESAQILNLEQLGLITKQLNILKINIKKPHGIILVTGPTGCGKTTTLYTIINILNNPGVNISTIEDPIEYRIPRVNQSQVNPKIGYTFATGLRAMLRQDPNIIMVGEIRDTETAEIAVHAALTGHLVLSTLHTNDAVGTLARLSEMGVPSFLIASTTNLIIAQRLVRKICPHCIMSYNLTKTMIKEMEEKINLPHVLETLEKEEIIQSAKQPLSSLLFYEGKGCKKCDGQGYKGRIGIFEVLEVTPRIAELILNKASIEELTRATKEQGMVNMIEDGFIKAKNGVTTIEEVLRVSQN